MKTATFQLFRIGIAGVSTVILYFIFFLKFLNLFLFFYNNLNTFWTQLNFMIGVKIVEQLTISPLIRKYEKPGNVPGFFVYPEIFSTIILFSNASAVSIGILALSIVIALAAETAQARRIDISCDSPCAADIA